MLNGATMLSEILPAGSRYSSADREHVAEENHRGGQTAALFLGRMRDLLLVEPAEPLSPSEWADLRASLAPFRPALPPARFRRTLSDCP